MPNETNLQPDNTAVRVALWRALHLEVDAPPPVFEDKIASQIAAPENDWRSRPDMDPEMTKPFRASIVARARFIEDLVQEQVGGGVSQYVILGAGLDTFAQRRPDLFPKLRLFEIDRPGTQAWKQKRLDELGLGIPGGLHFVPVDFDVGGSWRRELENAGFDVHRPAVVSSAGVSMYLTREAVFEALRDVASLAPGTTLALTFLVPIELADPEVRIGLQMSAEGARASGTPFISFFSPAEMLEMARNAGFTSVQHISSGTLAERYFAGRSDGLRPPKSAEEFLVAGT